MPHPRNLAIAATIVACLAAGSIPQSKGETLIVTRKTTRLRAQKRLFAPPIADLREGDRLQQQGRDGAWAQVAFQDKVGWVHEGDVSANKEVRLSGEGVRETYSASEAAAARKGFNPQVERQHRQGKPQLEAAFRLVDQIDQTPFDEAAIQSFLQQGGLFREAQR